MIPKPLTIAVRAKLALLWMECQNTLHNRPSFRYNLLAMKEEVC